MANAHDIAMVILKIFLHLKIKDKLTIDMIIDC